MNARLRTMLIFAVAINIGVPQNIFAQTNAVPARASPAANFRDDALLRRAEMDVPSMARHEIDLFTEVLAVCFVYGLNQHEERRDKCLLANERYSIAYGNNDRALDKILFALQLMYGIIATVDTKKQTEEQRKKTGSDIERMVTVSRALAAAVANRNRELSRVK